MPKWQIDIDHKGLNRSRTISGSDKAIVERKALEQRLLWEKEWLAEVRSREANVAIEIVQTVLSRALAQSHDVDWDNLKITSEYSVPPPAAMNSVSIPLEPRSTDWEFKINWVDRDRFRRAHDEWQRKKDLADRAPAAHKINIESWESDKKRFMDAVRVINESRNEDRAAFLTANSGIPLY